MLLIADEVITGFGRTGRWFALEHWGVQPDVVTFAKAVTSAYVPLSAFIVSERIHRAILDAPADTKFMIGCTNAAHPTACAVALRNLQIFDDEAAREARGGDGRAAERGTRAAVRDAERWQRAWPRSHGGGRSRGGQGNAPPFAPAEGIGPKLAKAIRERGRDHAREG